ncbi:methyl-accepting chemotaxis protein [Planomonospora venezuelensis]|uniref:Methyl-accepting chemotaxis protein n=2 Tax=Planomonospora venezuelensis TaxID=1999 RepID=A0A841DBC7_PLAVE|nr:methyl-accepting chemotaxis protein [Planomonospora venezuelensis]MBB5966799.1 methyl-accepting chemotaxis protein [Planomonospora venezuelensis]
MTIDKALRLGFAMVIGMLLLPAATSAWHLWQASSAVSDLAEAGMPGAQLTGKVDGLMNKYRKEQWEYLALPAGDEERAATVEAMAEEDAEMKGLFAEFRALPLDEAHLAAVAAYERSWTDYVRVTGPLAGLADGGDFAAARATFDGGAGDERWDDLKEGLKTLRELDVRAAAESRDEAGLDVVIGFTTLAVLLAAAVGLSLLVRRVLARRISTGLRDLSAAADRIARGDLDQRIEVAADDEIAEVAAAFDRMVEYLNAMAGVSQQMADGDLAVDAAPKSAEDRLGQAFDSMVRNLNDSIGQVRHSAGALDTASRELSGVSEDVRAAVGEVVGNAERQVDLVGQARRAAEQTSGLVEEGIGTVQQLTRVMRDLDEKSGRISDIVDTISRIAGQTNLLALNASIEAARAGVHGSGFAVVAGEVRALAEESSKAAQSIANVVAEIQHSSGEAVLVVDEHARGAFERIAGGTTTLRETLDEVGSFAGANMASTERMADATGAVTASVRQLAETADRLREVTGRFRTGRR